MITRWPYPFSVRYGKIAKPDWSTRTTLRVFEVPAQMTQSTFTAKVVVQPSATITTAGIQNWVLRIDRYSL
ncbi:hypothetical protein AB0J25_30770 [Streptomyces sp. NPDC049910]|uniref:hypothetical protein n=1 Tax=Streptomyces sp. NPDC049910 TaxID=3155278 RepID=UPI00343C5211